MNDSCWIGVDLGGTKILAGLFDDQMKLLARAKQSTPGGSDPVPVFGRVVELVETVLKMAGVEAGRVAGLGMGLPGQVEPGRQLVRYAPNLGWRDQSVAALLPSAWHWPVHIENDVRLGIYGEFTHGVARGAKHVLGIFVGTGVGGGLILNGELYSGFNFNAGEIGHTIIHWRKGTELEALAGRRSLMKRAAELLADAPKRLRKEWKGIDTAAVRSAQIADLYHRGDAVALQLVDDAARALGVAVASTINLLSPELVVIGGGLAGALGESFLERIWEVAQRFTLPEVTRGVRCVAATLADDSGIYGAAAYARSQRGERGVSTP